MRYKISLALCFSLVSLTAHADGNVENLKEVLDAEVFGNQGKGLNPIKDSEAEALGRLLKAQQSTEQPKNATSPEFDAASKELFPVSPNETRELNRKVDDLNRAKAELPRQIEPINRSDTIDVSPGAKIPVLRLHKNHVSTVVFLDATGQPWPIKGYDVAKELFNVTQPEKHVLTFSTVQDYAQSNISIMFNGLDVPVIVQLISGFEPVVDLKVEAHIAQLGPNAKPLNDSRPEVADGVLLGLLDGIPPANAKELKVKGLDSTKAWEYNGLYYLRTRAYLLSPAPVASSRASDGTRVYSLQKAPALAVNTIDGRTITVRITD